MVCKNTTFIPDHVSNRQLQKDCDFQIKQQLFILVPVLSLVINTLAVASSGLLVFTDLGGTFWHGPLFGLKMFQSD